MIGGDITTVEGAFAALHGALDDFAADYGCDRDELPDDAYADMARVVAQDIPDAAVRREFARRTGVRIGNYDPLADA